MSGTVMMAMATAPLPRQPPPAGRGGSQIKRIFYVCAYGVSVAAVPPFALCAHKLWFMYGDAPEQIDAAEQFCSAVRAQSTCYVCRSSGRGAAVRALSAEGSGAERKALATRR